MAASVYVSFSFVAPDACRLEVHSRLRVAVLAGQALASMADVICPWVSPLAEVLECAFYARCHFIFPLAGPGWKRPGPDSDRLYGMASQLFAAAETAPVTAWVER